MAHFRPPPPLQPGVGAVFADRSVWVALAELWQTDAEYHRRRAEELERHIRDARRAAEDQVEPPPQLIRAPEAARLLGMSPQYLYAHKDEYVFTRRIGRAVRFDRRALLDYLRQRGAGIPLDAAQ
jgi:predicted DNA-binding transcriptional regulator AlpA